MVRWVIESIPRGGPIELFFFPQLGCGIWLPVCGMVHIKELLLLIEENVSLNKNVFLPSIVEDIVFLAVIPS